MSAAENSRLRELYAAFEPEFTSLLRHQKAAFRRSVSLLEIIAAVAAVILFCSFHDEPDFLPVLGIGWILTAILIPVFKHFSLSGEQNVFFKRRIIPEMLKLFDPELRYSPSGGIPEADAVKSGLIRGRIDRYSCQDLVSGKYKGVPITFSEVTAQEKHTTKDSKGNTHTSYVVLFKGVLMRGDFHKNFLHRHFILPDFAEKFFGRVAGNFLQSMNVIESGRMTRLEDPEFEKQYAVYSEDAVEVRYLLTPKLMRTLVDIRKQFGHGTSVSFVNSSIYLALPVNRNLFEYEGGKLTPEKFEKTVHEFAIFLSVLDSLDLDLRIWSKQ